MNALVQEFHVVATTCYGDELWMRGSDTIKDDFVKLSIVTTSQQYPPSQDIQSLSDLEPMYTRIPTPVPTKRVRHNSMDDMWEETIGRDGWDRKTYSLQCSSWPRAATVQTAGWHFLEVRNCGQSVSMYGKEQSTILADSILYANEIVPFNMMSFGLKHDPGYTKAVVDSIGYYVQTLNTPIETIIVTTGWKDEIRGTLDQRVRCLSTDNGIQLYNEMVRNGLSAIVFLHLTC